MPNPDSLPAKHSSDLLVQAQVSCPRQPTPVPSSMPGTPHAHIVHLPSPPPEGRAFPMLAGFARKRAQRDGSASCISREPHPACVVCPVGLPRRSPVNLTGILRTTQGAIKTQVRAQAQPNQIFLRDHHRGILLTSSASRCTVLYMLTPTHLYCMLRSSPHPSSPLMTSWHACPNNMPR
jgi:hypothetical protein